VLTTPKQLFQSLDFQCLQDFSLKPECLFRFERYVSPRIRFIDHGAHLIDAAFASRDLLGKSKRHSGCLGASRTPLTHKLARLRTPEHNGLCTLAYGGTEARGCWLLQCCCAPCRRFPSAQQRPMPCALAPLFSSPPARAHFFSQHHRLLPRAEFSLELSSVCWYRRGEAVDFLQSQP
jgi:hypothetical protein